MPPKKKFCFVTRKKKRKQVETSESCSRAATVEQHELTVKLAVGSVKCSTSSVSERSVYKATRKKIKVKKN